MATRKAKAFAWVAIAALAVTTLSALFTGGRSGSRRPGRFSPEAIVSCLKGRGWDATYLISADGATEFKPTSPLSDADYKLFASDAQGCATLDANR